MAHVLLKWRGNGRPSELIVDGQDLSASVIASGLRVEVVNDQMIVFAPILAETLDIEAEDVTIEHASADREDR